MSIVLFIFVLTYKLIHLYIMKNQHLQFIIPKEFDTYDHQLQTIHNSLSKSYSLYFGNRKNYISHIKISKFTYEFQIILTSFERESIKFTASIQHALSNRLINDDNAKTFNLVHGCNESLSTQIMTIIQNEYDLPKSMIELSLANPKPETIDIDWENMMFKQKSYNFKALYNSAIHYFVNLNDAIIFLKEYQLIHLEEISKNEETYKRELDKVKKRYIDTQNSLNSTMIKVYKVLKQQIDNHDNNC